MMIEILENLFIGSQVDYENIIKPCSEEWKVVHACKEPYHRRALGYKSRGAPKDHPEYLFAYREGQLILNLVDVDNPDWISPVIIEEALKYINHSLNERYKVLVHCNQGMSRSAGLGLLYLLYSGEVKPADFADAEQQYTKLYPPYNPAAGMRGFIERHWSSCKQLNFGGFHD